jgi:plastocyanin
MDNVFDTTSLTAPAGEAFTLFFDNMDAGIPHNVSIYSDDTATTSLFVGELITGPDTITYEVPALDAGTYFFRCDVHPTTMTGTLTVG